MPRYCVGLFARIVGIDGELFCRCRLAAELMKGLSLRCWRFFPLPLLFTKGNGLL